MTPAILITSCSSTRMVAPRARVGNLPTGLTMQKALEEWLKLLGHEAPTLTPRELYRGLGFSTLVKIQDQFKLGGVKIVTGGQGLIDIDEKIVPYDFTASSKEPENIHQKVTAEPFVQTVWWRLINNARKGVDSPVAKLVSANQDKYVIISASKVFLRYISDDVLSIPIEHREKVRILLTASSIGSVPAQLRPMIVPFDRSSVSDLPGNRNDSNHRAALKFLEILQDPEFAAMDILQQVQMLEGDPSDNGKSQIDLEGFLRERPHYLTMPIEDAYRLTQRALGTVGGRMRFRSIMRSIKGTLIESRPEEVQSAVAALQSLGFTPEDAQIPKDNEEEEALKGIKIFVDALRQLAPKAMFQAVDICRWAPVYYKAQNQAIPAMMETPNRLAFVLKNNTAILGLSPNGKGYVLA